MSDNVEWDDSFPSNALEPMVLQMNDNYRRRLNTTTMGRVEHSSWMLENQQYYDISDRCK